MTNRASALLCAERSSQVELVHGASSSRSDHRLRGLVDAHHDFVWRCLRRLGTAEADTDDAVQEVFWVVARRIHEIDVGRERGFLFATAIRVAATQRRSASRRRESPDGTLAEHENALPSPEELTDQRRARALLDALLETLPFDLRTVFVLFELEELTAPEIAELLQIPVGTVASRLRRAREEFRAAVERRRAQRAHRERHEP